MIPCNFCSRATFQLSPLYSHTSKTQSSFHSFGFLNMSILSRQSSTWSILRSLDTLSPSPSRTSLGHFTACCKVGSIPIILHAGVGDLQNLVNRACPTAEPNDSGPMDLFNPVHKGALVSTGVESTEPCICPKQLSVSAQETARSMKDPPKAMPELLPPQPTVELTQEVPSNVPSTPESSLECSPISCFGPSGTRRASQDSSPRSPGTGKTSGPLEPSGHRRNGSTSTTDSGLSSRSIPPVISINANHLFSENAGIGAVRFPLLPVSLSWLQSTTLEVMIDQEGFRTIKPVFKLAGYAPPSTMESEVVSLGVHFVSATADFMPLQRKSFAFHYSELDTPPVLRRLMLNDDGSRDYLSRQAYLVLKANGPYSVQGTESAQSSRLYPTTEHSVLSWRFDYVVGDRRTESGRLIPGEKTFTPLSFSCSPALLLPAQGKKIRVVHVVKKSVAAKLTAVKIEPPRPPSTYLVLRATPLSDAESTGMHRARSKPPQDTPIHGASTYHPAQPTSSIFIHGTTEAFPPLPESLRSPKTHVGTSRAIVSPETINALFPIDTSHVVDEY